MMNLGSLHAAVRGLARGEVADGAGLAPAERAAFKALQRRLRAVGLGLDKLTPPAGSAVWLAPQPKPAEAIV
ncbi:MAG TPA: hypothetical protein VHS99_13730 [Chloroflexota bacterium]|jgi:hypothetical protein|nr:hypothetical protein [Chloroflexota bacterium]